MNATMREQLRLMVLTTLDLSKPYPLGIHTGTEHLEALAAALAHYARVLREAIDSSDKQGDKVTSDLYTGLAAQADKQLWFVEAHLQAKD